MNRKEIVVITLLALLVMAQVSLAPQIPLLNNEWLAWINPVNIVVVLIAFFEDNKDTLGWVSAFWGGILLDFYSGHYFFGFWILALLAFVALVKLIVKRYVRIFSLW